jgi:hypothetical protein
VRIRLTFSKKLATYFDFDATTLYSLYYTMADGIVVGFDLFEDQNQVLQIVSDSCDLLWTIID